MRDAQRRVHEGQSRTRVDALGRTSSEASVRLHRQAAAGSAPSRPQRPGAGTNGRAAAAAELQPRYVGVGWRWFGVGLAANGASNRRVPCQARLFRRGGRRGPAEREGQTFRGQGPAAPALPVIAYPQ